MNKIGTLLAHETYSEFNVIKQTYNHVYDDLTILIMFFIFFWYLFVFRDTYLFAIVNSFTSILAGLVIFSILGFMAKRQGVSVADVAESGKKNW